MNVLKNRLRVPNLKSKKTFALTVIGLGLPAETLKFYYSH